MTSQSQERARHEEVKRLLFEALDLPRERRALLLTERCADDPSLRAEVDSLLESYGELDGFLEQPLELKDGTSPPPECPQSIGRYRVLRILGYGSMGLVYLAEQPNPKRLVALKLLRQAEATEPARRRFEREAQVLGRFSHPGIASILEAGVAETEVGPRPYFTMEYVEGRPITEYAEQQSLDASERVRLALQMIEAVEHAHTQGVLHRDVKPANVLVDASGQVKVLDFGIAQLTREDELQTMLTGTGQLVGTVAYMSPEQARGATLDERTDQFSLGVILYELLSGELPYDTRGRLVHDALRSLAESDWRPLSQRDPALRGDLETILATALASEPVRRYPNLAALRADLQAWLEGRPIAARPPSTVYQLQRFVGRHRVLSAAVMVALLALGIGSGVAISALSQASQEARTALLFEDREVLDQLLREVDELWPTSSEVEPALVDWLARAEDLLSRIELHAAHLLDLEQEASESGAPPWRLRVARELQDSLEAFAGQNSEVGETSARLGQLRDEMRARLDQVRESRRITLVSAEAPWRDAAERVAADPRFDGLRLVPQEGLVPLGPDPRSGLEEFAVFATGYLPMRPSTSGSLQVSENSAIVLVLLPGGSTWVGAQRYSAGLPNLDPQATVDGHPQHNEGPPIRVELDPFLIGKHELSQAQWQRCFEFNPSDYEIGATLYDVEITGHHPLESVSWSEAMHFLPRVGLDLPTEAQWEFAARAGSTGSFGVGSRWTSLLPHAHLRRYTTERIAGLPEGALGAGQESVTLPIGSLAPNAFGLHDTLGNLWELCKDIYKVDYHRRYHRPGDGLVIAKVDGDYSRRGHSCGAPAMSMRVAARQTRLVNSGDAMTGVRVARALRLETHD